MGEKENQPVQVSFNPALKVDSQGSRTTSDGGLLLVLELDERLGLSSLIAEHILDNRRGEALFEGQRQAGNWHEDQYLYRGRHVSARARCLIAKRSLPKPFQVWVVGVLVLSPWRDR